MILKTAAIMGCLLFGIITTFFINYYILEPMLVPDPCAYHVEETSVLFNLFYTMKSSEGFHPLPSVFNFIVTLSLGTLIGLLLYKYCKSVRTK